MKAAKEEISRGSIGNVTMALIENGFVHDEYFYSIGEPVDRNTVFQVASLSKWVSAWGVMKLVEEGKLALDTPVSKYLTRWQLPPGDFDNDGVTVRRLLSHTAGLTDGLGYAGFPQGRPAQALESSLTKASDASRGTGGAVRVGYEPGSKWQYSGGGYTLLQLLIEEVTGQSFSSFMTNKVFEPLGMTHSTYQWNDSSGLQLAAFYDVDSTEAEHYRFTSLAASSLYTSLSDLELFLQAHVVGINSEPIGRRVLKPETVEKMREAHGIYMGVEIWGLGTMLFASNNKGTYIIGHDGKNEPAINTAARLDPLTGDGIIILETGNPLLASKLASQWVFWKTGNVDTLMFTFLTTQMLSLIGIGWIVMFLLMIIYIKRGRTVRKGIHLF
ncbi:D-alanyl-D-alanine carboxypeptidase [Fulvivirga imtechensis AK7]|uniref:D-alanyl-D-alanine carboxypeptidase n=2 Tax=Fulvivirga TaxID=396811 RepID=L8JVN4_9BACT|nr:D-alanyl-D-alanine carboxypeptidase [Fulvivirga imtechensis AK7]